MTELVHGDLDELLGDDAELIVTAGDVRAVLRAAEVDARFLRQLRARLVREREQVIAAGGAAGARRGRSLFGW
ncbi:MAG TPA: hypothetical protein VGO86_02525 [Candidatus Dormibacteraeota bacterium]